MLVISDPVPNSLHISLIKRWNAAITVFENNKIEYKDLFLPFRAEMRFKKQFVLELEVI